MNYLEAMAYLESLSDIERSRDVSKAPPPFNLERVERLLDYAGRPQDHLDCVHIAGTKGKGSTAAMVDAALRAAGYRVGLFTSPHLHSFLERISVDGERIRESDMATLVSKTASLVDAVHRRFPELGNLSTFEVTTAVALRHFVSRKVDFAVLETGMGGRLDATNVVIPRVSVITSISVDHTRFLGDSLLLIAAEKAGIVKSGVPLVVAPQAPEVMALVRRVCVEKGTSLIEVGRDVEWTARPAPQGEIVSVRGRLGNYSDLELPLAGAHQALNAAVAIATLETLSEQGAGVSEDDIRRGFASVWWPGRLETIGLAPRIVVDGAHNVESMRRLGEALSTAFPHRRLIVVMGASLDKDVPGMAREIAPLADVFIATRSTHPRAVETEALAGEARRCLDDAREVPDVASALRLALAIADKDDLICATGSLFVVAEAREAMGLNSASDRFRPLPHQASGR